MLTSSHNPHEFALLRRLQAGDDLAFDTLYQRHQPSVFRYALRMSGSPEIAEDIVQEVFLALIRGARGFDPSCGALSSYLYGIARNLLFKQLGAPPSEDLDLDTPAPESDPLLDLTQAERIQQLRLALAALPAHYREAVVFCDMEEMSYSEVAELLGVAVGTVRSRLHRARALLLARLNQNSLNQNSLNPGRCPA